MKFASVQVIGLASMIDEKNHKFVVSVYNRQNKQTGYGKSVPFTVVDFKNFEYTVAHFEENGNNAVDTYKIEEGSYVRVEGELFVDDNKDLYIHATSVAIEPMPF